MARVYSYLQNTVFGVNIGQVATELVPRVFKYTNIADPTNSAPAEQYVTQITCVISSTDPLNFGTGKFPTNGAPLDIGIDLVVKDEKGNLVYDLLVGSRIKTIDDMLLNFTSVEYISSFFGGGGVSVVCCCCRDGDDDDDNGDNGGCDCNVEADPSIGGNTYSMHFLWSFAEPVELKRGHSLCAITYEDLSETDYFSIKIEASK